MTNGWIGQAVERWDGFHPSDELGLPQLSAQQLSASLGCDVAGCELWKYNWRNRIYRVVYGDGTKAIAKQVYIGADNELEHEFNSLESLSRLSLGSASVPKPITYLPTLSTYLMEHAAGIPVDTLIRRGRTRDAHEACRLAAIALAELHAHWATGCLGNPIDDLAHDFERMPMRLSRREATVVADSLDVLRNQVIAVGQPYLDFKPANVIYDPPRVVLIDPPEQKCSGGLLAWDVAVFRQCLQQEIWRLSVIHPIKSRGRIAARTAATFEHAYVHHQPEPTLPPSIFHLLVNVLELQRIGQLLALQHGRLRTTHTDHSQCQTHSARMVHTIRVAAPLPWLRFQARQLIRKLNRFLNSRTLPSVACDYH